MTAVSIMSNPRRTTIAAAALKIAAGFWYLTAIIGQWAFVYYIALFYYGPTLRGHFEAWNRNDLIKGYVAGDKIGNLYFATHVLIAALVTATGTLQLLPQLRTRAPAFHRWNGRLFIATAFVMASGGLWMIWIRGTYLNLYGAASSSIIAVLILLCASMTLHHALARRISAHRRWALRTFLVVNGVWFQRIGYMAWIILNRGPVGIGEHMDGPFDIVLGFAVFVLPLSVLELYLYAQEGAGSLNKLGVAMVLFVLTAIMAIGTAGASMFMWRPLL